ncbi:hypothetical protein [Brevibacillus daliensis]|uniref:hypothetical protein n=1 Tax=Brevibacillus daliensis TaxID=2892995 RepID=UPI001E54D222|nr:hypothetical protein [Brevibacillus daliensis]
MEKCNAKLLSPTRKISKDTLQKSNETIKKLTQPPEWIRIGSVVGGCIGVGLLITETAGFIIGKIVWPIGMVTVGIVSVEDLVSGIVSVIKVLGKLI